MGRRPGGVGRFALAVAGLLASGLPATAQERGPVATGGSWSMPAPVTISRTTDEIRLDGSLDDASWASADEIGGFRQVSPEPGAAATEDTRVRVLLSDESLYVGFLALDGDPDAVVGQVTRRDADSFSDRVHVVIDSYGDGQTAFHFGVNPAGVRWDRYRYADTQEDAGWDPVWDVATLRHADGWSAEFRIPLSQLRFDPANRGGWGVNFYREIARRNEVVHWAPIPADESAFVSRFGRLEGVDDIDIPRRVEILPYSVVRGERGVDGRSATGGNMGLDAKLGLPAGLTLDLTVNPDFGQVEADPGEMNLSGFETAFPERRPFFLEGMGLFQMELAPWEGSPQSLFYSRRIGASPTRRPAAGEGRVELDDRVSILAAAKVSGQTRGGWGIGAFAALTGREEAHRFVPGAAVETLLAEPRTSWSLLRVQREFGRGRSRVGAMVTHVGRDAAGATALGLTRRALTAGVDGRHRFAGDRWRLRGSVAGSSVEGDAATIAALQQSPNHAFQRPGIDRFDPGATRMTGWSAQGAVEKFAGGTFRFAVMGWARSAGFEANDLGFSPQSDMVQVDVEVNRVVTTPGPIFRSYTIGANLWQRHGLAEDVWQWRGVSGWISGRLHNFWRVDLRGAQAFVFNDRNLLRGGPTVAREPNRWRQLTVETDSRAAVQGTLSASLFTRPGEDTQEWGVNPGIRWRPSGRTRLNLGAGWSSLRSEVAWVGARGPVEARRYVVGRLRQTTASLTLRVDHAFSPDLTLEAYAQPFLSSGHYDTFREVVNPGAEEWRDQFAPLERDGDAVALPGGDRVSIPDFSFRQLNTNVVFRWAFRPGSTLFLVWSQGRVGSDRTADFDFGRETTALFDLPSTHRLQAKISWWFGG